MQHRVLVLGSSPRELGHPKDDIHIIGVDSLGPVAARMAGEAHPNGADRVAVGIVVVEAVSCGEDDRARDQRSAAELTLMRVTARLRRAQDHRRLPRVLLDRRCGTARDPGLRRLRANGRRQEKQRGHEAEQQGEF